MRQRDVIILAVIGVVVVVGGYWMLLLSPKRKELAKLDKEVAEQQQQLKDAQSQARTAQDAKVNFASTYETLAKIGKAAPPAGSVDDDIPALILQLDHAGIVSKTALGSIEMQAAAAEAEAPASASPPASGEGSEAAPSNSEAQGETAPAAGGEAAPAAGGEQAAAASTLTPVPFTLDYSGDFFRLENLINYLNSMVHADGKALKIKGRLFNITAIEFTTSETESGGSTSGGGGSRSPKIKALITVDAFSVPGETEGDGAAPGGAAPSTAAAPPTDGGGPAASSVPPAPPATVRRP
ncbi:MAG: type II secretion system protein GspM [Solirubrobacterales bacterium]